MLCFSFNCYVTFVSYLYCKPYFFIPENFHCYNITVSSTFINDKESIIIMLMLMSQ